MKCFYVRLILLLCYLEETSKGYGSDCPWLSFVIQGLAGHKSLEMLTFFLNKNMRMLTMMSNVFSLEAKQRQIGKGTDRDLRLLFCFAH